MTQSWDTLKKYLVYESFTPPYTGPEWKAVEAASGRHGLMDGIAPESRVYYWWADSGEAAISMVKDFVKGGKHAN